MKRRLALFDLDHTLISYDSGADLLRFLVARELVDAGFVDRYTEHCIEYVAGRVDLRQLNREYYALLMRYPVESLTAWRNEWREESGKHVSAAAMRLVHSHHASGDLCCLVTATSEFIASAYREIFGFEHMVATRIAMAEGPQGSFISGEVEGLLNYREGKIANVRDWLLAQGLDWSSFDESVFYSDSFNDLPLLEYVSHPVAVTPDARLRAVAIERGWRILDLA